MSARIAAVGTALPAHRFGQAELYETALAPYFHANPRARGIFEHPGVQTRASVLADPAAFFAGRPGAGARNAVFAREAPPLAERAARAALAACGWAPDTLDVLVTITCTGYVTPGLDLLLARALGMPPALRRFGLGGMGCYASFPGLNLALATLAGPARRALVVATELCTLHFQAEDDTDNVVSTALFADGAAAYALEADAGDLAVRGPGWEVVDTRTATLYDTAQHMTWTLTDTGFRMHLSAYVPMILREATQPWLAGWLGDHGLTPADIPHWGIHPGGPRVLDGLQASFGLSDAQLAASRAVLRDCGNMSSATIGFILARLGEAAPRAGERAVLLAFGPGLTMEGALLRWRDDG